MSDPGEGQAGPGAERIVAAAIKVGPVVHTGPHHATIIHQVVACGGETPVRGVQGFVTSTGRFVDRWAGRKIAFAAGQVATDAESMLSEELWIVPEPNWAALRASEAALAEARLDADHDWALWREKWTATVDTYTSLLEAAHAEATKAERERCAKLVEDHGHSNGKIRGTHRHLAEAIRKNEAPRHDPRGASLAADVEPLHGPNTNCTTAAAEWHQRPTWADIAHRLTLAVHADAHPSCCAGGCNVFDNMVFHVDLAMQDLARPDCKCGAIGEPLVCEVCAPSIPDSRIPNAPPSEEPLEHWCEGRNAERPWRRSSCSVCKEVLSPEPAREEPSR